MIDSHDTAYKKLFSSPELVRDLVLGFIADPWLQGLDFDTLEKMPGEYVSDDDRQRRNDVVWRVKVDRLAFKQEGLEAGRREGMERGKLEGKQEGEGLALQWLLTRRFGNLPNEYVAKIGAAGKEQIELWLLIRVLDADSLESVFE
ncbi:MAG: Rpn family recombination-promoting nuclease/putative transposase [Methylococcales bacterium]|nr:Rpn family recombination-promoting nuclease/putative transposase [Methylococcales bacterium]